MAYIAPDSIIRILRNVPLDNTYKDTILFDSTANQTTYFTNKAKYSYLECSYLRKENKIRVAIKADNLYDCNYIMFQNKAFGSKWFYAFITNVEYVNNETSAISYEIDVMQTWAFDYTLKPCYVEREHTATDLLGSNLIPENLETGEFKFYDLGMKGITGNWVPVICATVNHDFTDATPSLQNGIYNGCSMIYLEGINATTNWLEELTTAGKSDAVINMVMFPLQFIDITAHDKPKTISFSVDKNLNNLDGYVPKNKKLFTYPYNFLYVTDNEGKSAEYRYEYFDSTTCDFDANCLFSPQPEGCITPKKYKGVDFNYNERMTLGNFPLCSWQTDTFMAWLAMNASQLGVATAASVGTIMAGLSPVATAAGTATVAASGGTELATLGSAGTTEVLNNYNVGMRNPNMVIGGATSLLGLLAKANDTYIKPPRLNGTNTGSMNVALGEKGFHFYYAHIGLEFARAIDDFWTMYGYPCRKLKVPNRNVRPHWTYTKTVDACITGSIPVGDMAVIKRCYNNGITFWKFGDEVGNYNLDNTV